MSMTREQALQILDRNAKTFAEHTDQLRVMDQYHKDRMKAFSAQTSRLEAYAARLDAHQDILYSGFFGRLKWLMFGG